MKIHPLIIFSLCTSVLLACSPKVGSVSPTKLVTHKSAQLVAPLPTPKLIDPPKLPVVEITNFNQCKSPESDKLAVAVLEQQIIKILQVHGVTGTYKYAEEFDCSKLSTNEGINVVASEISKEIISHLGVKYIVVPAKV